MVILDKIRALLSKGMYVTLNTVDDSVTFSPALVRRLRRLYSKDLRVLTFKVDGTRDYAFCVAPKFDELTEDVKLPTIQYNGHTKEFGYHCFNPSVNAIAYDWSYEYGTSIRSKVTVQMVRGQRIYIMHSPW